MSSKKGKTASAFLVFLLVSSISAGAAYYFSLTFDRYALLPQATENLADTLTTIILALGVGLAAALAVVLYLGLTVRSRAEAIASELTEDIAFSREQFRQFYELSPVPYLLVSPAGNIDRPNKAAIRFFGTTTEALTGADFFQYLVPEDTEKPHEIESLQEKLKRRMPVTKQEIQITAKDGAIRWILLSIGTISTEGSDAFWGLITLVDITEQKELDRVKTEFISLASHQLRTPLSNVKWYIEFILLKKSEGLGDEVRKLLGEIGLRNQQMIDLVNTLLNLSRIEMGRAVVEKEDTDISALITDVLGELTVQAEQKSIVLKREYEEGVHATTDPRLLRVVIQNLLSNALRYTPAEGSVTLSMRRMSSGLVVDVSDTGCGIPPEEKGKIFTKLYRASNAKLIEANGNGIGLYMSKELIEAMGGTIDFTSELDKGTTFTIVLPQG